MKFRVGKEADEKIDEEKVEQVEVKDKHEKECGKELETSR